MWLLRLCFKDSVFFKLDKSFPLHPGCCLLVKKYYLPLKYRDVKSFRLFLDITSNPY